MSQNSIKHYEQVWVEAESLASKKFQSHTTTQLLEELSKELNSYKECDANPDLSSDTKSILKMRHMGTILFVLCAISHRDDINTWAALASELLYERLDFAELQKLPA